MFARLGVASGGGDVEEGAAVLVAEGEVGRGEGGERGGVAGLRAAEQLLLRRSLLPAGGGVDDHRRGRQVEGGSVRLVGGNCCKLQVNGSFGDTTPKFFNGW